jgi:hypothetical protein
MRFWLFPTCSLNFTPALATALRWQFCGVSP